MALFEKIFQRDDKFFLQAYIFLQGLFLFINSSYIFYLRNGTFKLNEDYLTGSILLVIIFWVSGFIKIKEFRYLIGTVQFIKIEFILLIQTFLIAILLTTIFKLTDNYSRIWFFSTFFVSFLSLIILKIFFDLFYHYLLTSNIIQRNIILVGDSQSCEIIVKKFPKKTSNSVIKCLIMIDDEKSDQFFLGIPRIKMSDDIGYVLRHHSIGQVWIVSSIRTQPFIENTIDQFLNYPVDCRLVSPESKFKFIEGLDSEAGYDFYNISFSPFYGTGLFIKNVLDKTFGLIFLTLAMPVIILASIIIFAQEGLPIFFKQKRTGWDGKSFYIYKLRTLAKSSTIPDTQQVKSGDSRITFFGAFMRRFSIDELPQFFNIIKGDMSIVGPRPHMIEHTKYYSQEILNFMQRHKCLPGLTGWAQIHGFRGPTENKEKMDKRFQHDLYYIKNWSLMLDLYIIIRSFFVIFFQKVD